ncbi:hypothetical protein MLD38_037153 [Melastoma candidum]|uniref:Uncharacterized protein n=1 Tax=Melastoma candidum TaxID=119954 RepID=A0ACB9LM55_9MYRT|nr:hypothetical protein MLD38_037153 [Melastoma candidum]
MAAISPSLISTSSTTSSVSNPLVTAEAIPTARAAVSTITTAGTVQTSAPVSPLARSPVLAELFPRAPVFTVGPSTAGVSAPVFIPPLAAFTTPAIESSTAPPVISPLNLNMSEAAQSANDTSLGVKVETLTTELSSLKLMMAEFLQRQPTTTPAISIVSQNPHLPPIMPGSTISTMPPYFPHIQPSLIASSSLPFPHNHVNPGSAISASIAAPFYNPHMRGPPFSSTTTPPYLPPYYPQPSVPGPNPFQSAPLGPSPYFPAVPTTAGFPVPRAPHVESTVPNPTSRNAAIVDQLFGEQQQTNAFETRLEAKIATIQEEEARRMARMEERLNAIQGHQAHNWEYANYHVPQIQVPPKFKMPEFEKFRGNGCPELHLKHFCHKMAVYPVDDKFRIAMFQESLAESALHWYYTKDVSQYTTFKELALDFLNYYSFNVEMAPTISDLRKLRRYRSEDIKQFAYRFREMASQIKPALKEKELIDEFFQLLPREYLPYMIGQTITTFAQAVINADKLDGASRDGLIPPPSVKPAIKPKPKELVAAAEHNKAAVPPTSYAPRSYAAVSFRPPVAANLRQPAPMMVHQQPKPTRQERPRRRLEDLVPTPDPLDVMFTRLRDMGFISPVDPKPTNPSSFGYNPKASCQYHSGALGHDTKDCIALKFKIQNLLDDGVITFPTPATTPNVMSNPWSKRSLNMPI